MTTTTVPETLVSAEELYEMGDIGPCELIEGRIIKMSPTKTTHGRLESRLDRWLGNFVEANDLGEVMTGETGIYTKRNPDTVRGADILFISHGRLKMATPDKFLDVAPELVIEILSPSDRWKDMEKKIAEYFAIGVEWVWVVDPKKKAVMVFSSSETMKVYKEGDVLSGESISKGFQLDISKFFSRL